jgi:methylated-DNA-[protein]-cysteine S-methyltransferase
MIYKTFTSPIGDITISSNGVAVTELHFNGARYFEQIPVDWTMDNDHPLLRRTEKQIGEYFNREREYFDLPLTFSGTPFQVKVWKELQKIPYGQTISYQDLGEKIGTRKAVRAVGTAVGNNPISIIIPCHRVLRKNGELGGYAAGLVCKEQLLELEQK